jgi:hypothetical protein
LVWPRLSAGYAETDFLAVTGSLEQHRPEA